MQGQDEVASSAEHPRLGLAQTLWRCGSGAREGAASGGWRAYEALVSAPAPIADAGRGDNDLAALFYTSGSTGEPTGVMHSHAHVVTAGFACIPPFGLDEDARVLI